MNLSQLDKFMEQVNSIRSCITPQCSGILIPVHVRSTGLGGAISVSYTCSGCASHSALFETSSKYELTNTSEISVAVQVAFIVAGCTHATYWKTLKHALGIDAVHMSAFLSTIERIYPVVKQMVDEMCDKAKQEMKNMDQDKLGSWSRAVTSADGVWMTRGWHSKNATFSIRNYFTGALLYRMHLCQRGRDKVIKEDLYQGTSKGAEGFAARKTFTKAKEEGMNVEIHWQDADSSSSKGVAELFPDARVMICGGHAGRAHMKQLQKLAKKKSPTKDMIGKYSDQFPQINEAVCHCKEKHSPGCGCLSEQFIEKARNNFSLILSKSESAEMFATKINALAKHACDVHKWDNGCCDFHSQRVCSCNHCEDKENFKCEGQDYHTRLKLTCPFHSLAYEIDCHVRAQMAEQVVHPILKRGHSNWLEASHNVLIRFRPKHINLERLHYELSTDLGLLQSNMTYMYELHGPQYHWIPELYRRLKLPVYDGIQQALEVFNQQRKVALDKLKTDEAKRKRLQLKMKRTKESQIRKAWSKKHGHDTYGDEAEDIEHDHSLINRGKKRQKASEGKCAACGSTTHRRSNHKDCPFNKRRKIEISTLKHTDSIPEDGDIQVQQGDLQDDSEELDESFSSSSDDRVLDDEVISGILCVCGAINRAHKSSCPMSSRNYPSRVLFPSNEDAPNETVAPTTKLEAIKPDVAEINHKNKVKPFPSFVPGTCVCLHNSKLIKQHIPCRIVRVVGERYQLCCKKGILDMPYPGQELMTSNNDPPIPLDKWRQSSRVSLRHVISDPSCLESCTCNFSGTSLPTCTIVLSDDSDDAPKRNDVWLQNLLYTLTISEQEIILSPIGWLNDSIISAAQMLMLQQFPHMTGLEPPTLAQTMAFQVHRGDFVQILNIRNCHWCTISNIGCEEGVVNVYDSMYSSVSTDTIRIIASMMLSSASKLVIRMMDVVRQINGSDCGVLSIAFAYDLCSGVDPCRARYDHKLIRQHLLKCLEDCHLSRFPVVSDRRITRVKCTQEVDLHCSCRLPEEEGDEMAECDSCKRWYHRHCMDIPQEVFSGMDVPWTCKLC